LADIVSEQPAPLARPQPQPSVSRRKFAIAYLALAAIVGAAVGLVVVFAGRDDGGSTQREAFASWTPKTTGTLGVREIAPT
jgi:ferric-dicitrate binding protein FerR (iron transport regulator)